MKDSQKNSTVYPLRLNSASFEIILQAIHNLSARTQRFETFASVITAGTRANIDALPKALTDLASIMPIEGDIKVFVRLSTDRHKEFEWFRTLLNEAGEATFGVRDAVMACTLLIAPRN
ncbi:MULTISPECIES: hypothetical protein [unclassified Novosphingobium]|uniref:hypothetical protein n=1 Tax=unclassified Novosphingobium TaxID=2644732 RepID=UPI0013580BD4|nr:MULTISPECIES: hypothetical protein [unclassified Novosphingobium]